jgi:DNA-binding XRE family transcriptional regulator
MAKSENNKEELKIDARQPRVNVAYEAPNIYQTRRSSYWSEIYGTSDFQAWLDEAEKYFKEEDDTQLQFIISSYNLDDRASFELAEFYRLFVMDQKRGGLDTKSDDVILFNIIKSFQAMEENGIEFERSVPIDRTNLQDLQRQIDQAKTEWRVAEGVTNERSHPMSEEKDRQLGGKFNVAAEEQAVGEMYAELREALGLTKVAAAEMAGLPESSVRKLEKGSQTPTLKTLRNYASSLGYEARIELVPKDKS